MNACRAGQDMQESETRRAECQEQVHKLMRLVPSGLL